MTDVRFKLYCCTPTKYPPLKATNNTLLPPPSNPPRPTPPSPTPPRPVPPHLAHLYPLSILTAAFHWIINEPCKCFTNWKQRKRVFLAHIVLWPLNKNLVSDFLVSTNQYSWSGKTVRVFHWPFVSRHEFQVIRWRDIVVPFHFQQHSPGHFHHRKMNCHENLSHVTLRLFGQNIKD